jgi:outer membrane lipopolysaccharide assembly protein LptE/RlpB
LKTLKRRAALPSSVLVLLLVSFLFAACGYQLVSDKGIFGGEIVTIDVPVFKNKTYEPHTSQYVTEAFARELISTGLFKVNQPNPDGYIQGNITDIKVLPATLNKDGIVIEKIVTMSTELSLYRKNGSFLKRWVLSESESYRVDNVDYEDYNKRDAIKRISSRMARKFYSVLLVDY